MRGRYGDAASGEARSATVSRFARLGEAGGDDRCESADGERERLRDLRGGDTLDGDRDLPFLTLAGLGDGERV